MKKKSALIASSLTFLLISLFVSCGNTKVDEVDANKESKNIIKEFTEQNIVIKKTDINSIKSKNLLESLKSKDGQEGIFCFMVSDTSNENIKTEYLLFNGIDKGFKDFSFELNNNVLKVKCSYNPESTNHQEIYLLERLANAPLDSIEVSLTKEDGRVTIYEF